MAWDAAPDGSCLLFDGSSSAVDCGNSEDYHSQQEYTYFALISPATVSSSYRAIVVHRYHSKGAVIGYWTRDDDFYWQVRNDDASSGFLETIYHNLPEKNFSSIYHNKKRIINKYNIKTETNLIYFPFSTGNKGVR